MSNKDYRKREKKKPKKDGVKRFVMPLLPTVEVVKKKDMGM